MCKISFVIPVYNALSYLARCVSSIAKIDTYTYEIILIDDGSTDGSSQLADKLAQEYENVRVFHQENTGAAGARNTGIHKSNGEYLMFIDSDDYVSSVAVEKMIAEADKCVLDIGVSDLCYVSDSGEIRFNNEKPYHTDNVIAGIEYLKRSLMSKLDCPMTVTTNIYRRSFILENKLWFLSGVSYEDEEWMPRAYCAALRVKDIPRVFYYYYLHDDSISRNPSVFRRTSTNLIHICQITKEFIKKIDDLQLQELLGNRVALLYLSAVFKAKMIGKEDNGIVNKKFFRGLKLKGKTLVKAKFFCMSKIAYYYVNRSVKYMSTCPASIFCHKLKDKASDRINHTRRKPYKQKLREKLNNHDFSIISSNCIGGVVSSDLHERFNSPTINLYMLPEDYLRFLKKLDYYLCGELVEDSTASKGFPVGIIDDIHIYFMHYRTFEEARNKWNERCTRVNRDNLYVVMTDMDGCTDAQVRDFDNLPYKNKIIFTSKEFEDCISTIYCEEYKNEISVGSLTAFIGLSGKRVYDRYFSFVDWLNK